MPVHTHESLGSVEEVFLQGGPFMAHVRQSRPESGLGLSRFQYDNIEVVPLGSEGVT